MNSLLKFRKVDVKYAFRFLRNSVPKKRIKTYLERLERDNIGFDCYKCPYNDLYGTSSPVNCDEAIEKMLGRRIRDLEGSCRRKHSLMKELLNCFLYNKNAIRETVRI
jgi:hypothetical protein